MSMDKVSLATDDIHQWHILPCMRFFCPGMTSTDVTFIHGWDLLIHGWNCHLSDFAYILQSFGVILAKIGNLCEKNVTEDNYIHRWTSLIHVWRCHLWMSSMDGKCHQCMSSKNVGTASMDESFIGGHHPWMEKPHPWMEVSSINVIHGWRTIIHGWHPQMRMTDDGHGRSHSFTLT